MNGHIMPSAPFRPYCTYCYIPSGFRGPALAYDPSMTNLTPFPQSLNVSSEAIAAVGATRSATGTTGMSPSAFAQLLAQTSEIGHPDILSGVADDIKMNNEPVTLARGPKSSRPAGQSRFAAALPPNAPPTGLGQAGSIASVSGASLRSPTATADIVSNPTPISARPAVHGDEPPPPVNPGRSRVSALSDPALLAATPRPHSNPSVTAKSSGSLPTQQHNLALHDVVGSADGVEAASQIRLDIPVIVQSQSPASPPPAPAQTQAVIRFGGAQNPLSAQITSPTGGTTAAQGIKEPNQADIPAEQTRRDEAADVRADVGSASSQLTQYEPQASIAQNLESTNDHGRLVSSKTKVQPPSMPSAKLGEPAGYRATSIGGQPANIASANGPSFALETASLSERSPNNTQEAPSRSGSELTLPVAETMQSPAVSSPAPSEKPASIASAAFGPAEQIVRPIASLLLTPAHATEPKQIILRLDPQELGKVEVRIVHLENGPTKIELMVERPETLLLLQRDQPQLHKALDMAAGSVESRTIQFHLALQTMPAPQNPAGPTGDGPPAQSFSQNLTSNHDHGQPDPSRGGDRQRQPTAKQEIGEVSLQMRGSEVSTQNQAYSIRVDITA